MDDIFLLKFRVTNDEPWRFRVLSNREAATTFARGLEAMGIQSYSFDEKTPLSIDGTFKELEKILDGSYGCVPTPISQEKLKIVFNGGI